MKNTIEQYKKFNYSDPQTTTDADLFGEWALNRWVRGPLLDYERVSGLKAVEKAAKEACGDYSMCKKYILEYYNKKFDTYHFEPVNEYDKRAPLAMEMHAENFTTRLKYGGAYPVDKLLLNQTPAWHEADILDVVEPVTRATDKRITLHLYAMKKDGNMALFHSREHESDQPYIEMIVNGEKRSYRPVADTYVSAGSNGNTNYGSEPLLLAEESYSSIHKAARVDEYSRRSILKFAFPDLKENDAITRARLCLYGWMQKSDNPLQAENLPDSKRILVMNDQSENDWEEKSFAWVDYAKASFICLSYDGLPGVVNQSIQEYYPNMMFYRSYLMGLEADYMPLSEYVAVTKDEMGAYHLLRGLINKIKELNCDFISVEQPTLENFRVREYPELFERLRFSKYMTPEVFTIILKSVYEHCEAIVGSDRYSEQRDKIWTQYLRSYNIGALQTSALFKVSLVFDEFKAVHAPLGDEWAPGSYNGGWLAVCNQRFRLCLQCSSFPDGSTTDVPINYLWTNLENYLYPLSVWSKTFGLKPDDIFTPDILNRILQVGEYAAGIINPLGGTWQEGDAEAYYTKQIAHMQTLCSLFPDKVSEHLKYIASEGSEGMPSIQTSQVSDYQQRAVLRSSWDKEAVALHIQANSGLKHTHFDDLAINMFAYGNYLLADPNRYNYVQDDAISNWQMSREAHNSIQVDGINPNKTMGSMHPEDRELGQIYDYLHADSYGYDGHPIDRHICYVKPGYFLVTDLVKSCDGEEHNYKLNWHFQPSAKVCLEKMYHIRTNFEKKANLLVAVVEEPGMIEYKIEDGHYSQCTNQVLRESYQYISCSKTASGDVSFQTLLYPMPVGENISIHTEPLACSLSTSRARAMHAEISQEGMQRSLDYYLLLDRTKETKAVYGRYETDAGMALIEQQNGKIHTIILRGGSYIKDMETGNYIIKLKKSVKYIGISCENGEKKVESADFLID